MLVISSTQQERTFKNMSEIKTLITKIEDKLTEIERTIDHELEPEEKDKLLTRYLSMITEIKENLIKLDKENKG